MPAQPGSSRATRVRKVVHSARGTRSSPSRSTSTASGVVRESRKSPSPRSHGGSGAQGESASERHA